MAAATNASTIDNGVLLFAGFVVGLFAIGPLARTAPQVVNSFLLLVLLSALLLQRDRWLPYVMAVGVPRASSKAAPLPPVNHPGKKP